MTWRDRIRPLVAEVIDRVGKSDPKELRRALLDARPEFVLYTSHMSKVWREEVKRQTEEAECNGVAAMATENGASVRHWDGSNESARIAK